VFGNLNGRVAIVSGSGANIGEACARALAGAGASVVLADINIVGATAVAADIEASGGSAMAHPLDLAQEDSIKALIAATVERFGRIDILHNNAADTRVEQMAADANIAEMDAAVWDRAFTVNTRGTMLMIKHAVPHIIAAGGGSIINTSTGVSVLGDIFNPAYSSSKGAINALTRNVAAQFGRQNIRCNAVLPGLVLSPLARKIMTEDQIKMIQRHVLLPRYSKPEDIAGAVLFLASDASSFVTGQIISVDGGVVHHTPYFADVMDAIGAPQAVLDPPA
jgi:NAD(P)-dependent dehydrogenase (short-subunit alcohol dehydrogenase family)